MWYRTGYRRSALQGVGLCLVVMAPAFADDAGDPGSADASRSETAALRGTMTVRAVAQDPPVSLGAYARRRYRPPTTPGVPGGSEDAVVYLESLTSAISTAANPTVPNIVQRDRTIAPHVTAAPVGEEIAFPNEDDVFHNLFSLSEGNRFNLGRYGPGQSRTHEFASPGVVRLFCDIHAEMAGVILVVESPYYTTPDADGAYRLAGVVPGRYRAIAWHPVAGADTIDVDLAAGVERNLDFGLRADR